VAVELDLRDGLQQPGTIDVTTRYRGGMADRMRSALNNGSREQRQTDYVNYLATYYPGVRVGKAFTVEDDTRANELAIHVHYVLAEPFRKNDAGELEEEGVRPATRPAFSLEALFSIQSPRLFIPADWGHAP